MENPRVQELLEVPKEAEEVTEDREVTTVAATEEATETSHKSQKRK
jgi:hypothetical protein